MPARGDIGCALGVTRLNRNVWRVVAREISGIDIKRRQRTGGCELHDAMIEALLAPTARLPTIHPLTMIVIDARAPLWLRGIEEAFLGAKEFIRRVQHPGTQALIGEIHVTRVIHG